MLQPFDDTYFMKKALQEAQEAYRQGEIPVGAVVVAGGTIIARAHNLTETLTDVTTVVVKTPSVAGDKYEC